MIPSGESHARQSGFLNSIGGFSSREQLLLIGLMAPTGLSLVSSGMISVALPPIQKEYNVAVDLLAWVVAAAWVPRVALEPIYGHLADVLGKRRLYLIGLALFTLGTILCFFAPTFLWLVLAAALQGIGMASFSVAMALITEVFPEERRGRALGLWNAAAPVGLMIGPFIGGAITDWAGWRANMVVLVIACALAIYLVVRFVPAENRFRAVSPFDWLGAAALITCVGSLLLAGTTGSLIPLGSPLNVTLWLVAGLALVVLVWNGRYRPHPLITPDIIRNRRFVGPALAVNFRMFAHDGSRFLLVLFLADAFGQSPGAVGIWMFFYGLPLLIGVMYGGYLADRWSIRTAGLVGIFGQTAGLLWIGVVGGAGPLALVPGMVAAALFGGASLVPFSKEAVGSLGRERIGLSSGLYNMLRYAGSAAATPLIGLILANQFTAAGIAESAVGPYQLAFQFLAVIAALGALATLLIPVPARARVSVSGSTGE